MAVLGNGVSDFKGVEVSIRKQLTKMIPAWLGHSNVVITEHYLSGLNPDVTFGINDSIL
jgi:hypothetical protein